MIKRYCDICERQVYDADNARITPIKKESVWKKVKLDVIVNVKVGKEYTGDICRQCLLEYLSLPSE